MRLPLTPLVAAPEAEERGRMPNAGESLQERTAHCGGVPGRESQQHAAFLPLHPDQSPGESIRTLNKHTCANLHRGPLPFKVQVKAVLRDPCCQAGCTWACLEEHEGKRKNHSALCTTPLLGRGLQSRRSSSTTHRTKARTRRKLKPSVTLKLTAHRYHRAARYGNEQNERRRKLLDLERILMNLTTQKRYYTAG